MNAVAMSSPAGTPLRVRLSTGAARRLARVPATAASPSWHSKRGASVAAVRATGDKEETESREVLDAFFVGKALAETLLERAGEAVSEALSAVGRAEAERDEAIRQFQDDVVNKAREAQRRERGGDDQIR